MAAVWPALQSLAPVLAKETKEGPSEPIWVNDIHSQLNPTRVSAIHQPKTVNDLQQILQTAQRQQQAVSVCGGRHSMGGQQFGTDMTLIDTRAMNSIFEINARQGIIRVEAGLQWPELMQFLVDSQQPVVRKKTGDWLLGQPSPKAPVNDAALEQMVGEMAGAVKSNIYSRWGIRQKPTGTDAISLGGSLSSNVHGRGLKLMPICADVEAIELVNAQGEILQCSRLEHPELFSLALGGYGLFGLIYTVQLRLWTRRKIRRRVSVVDAAELMNAFNDAIAQKAVYGDFQFNIDPASSDFMTRGIFSYYEPVDEENGAVPIPPDQKVLSVHEWAELVYWAHTDPGRAFKKYQDHYLTTDGQIYWSDLSQTGPYRERYHQSLDLKTHAKKPGTEMISELYVPRDELATFLKRAAGLLKQQHAKLIYGTVRLIEKDRTTFLPWAKASYACVIVNLHVQHDPTSLAKAKRAFQDLIDIAIALGGSYYLTYHRWARKDQVLACYPQFPEFLKLKKQYDPDERFQSNWYQHYKAMFAS